MLGTTVRRLRRALRARALAGLPVLLRRQDFRRQVNRERARSDRSGRDFALIVIHLMDNDLLPLLRLPHLLQSCIRELDDLGWFGEEEVGLLLPETSDDGASAVVEKVAASLEGASLHCGLRHYIYRPRCSDPDVCGQVACGSACTHHGKARGDVRWTDPGPRPGEDDRDPPPGPGGAQGPGPDTKAPDATPPADPARPPDGAPDPRTAEVAGQVPRRAATAVAVPDGAPRRGLSQMFIAPLPPWKRATDVAGALVLLGLAAPLMAAAALAVAATSRGPVIFRQRRAGVGGRPFWFYKFRTMYADAESRKKDLLHLNEATGPVFKMERDPRITPVGRLLRRTSIDELPQLWNVLRGDMSLVGPRPPTLDEVPRYASWQHRRLEVTGGLTCIWQVSGRCLIPFDEWMRMDLRYARRVSPWTDLVLLARTVGAVASRRGAK